MHFHNTRYYNSVSTFLVSSYLGSFATKLVTMGLIFKLLHDDVSTSEVNAYLKVLSWHSSEDKNDKNLENSQHHCSDLNWIPTKYISNALLTYQPITQDLI
jgi:hypothetical protein